MEGTSSIEVEEDTTFLTSIRVGEVEVEEELSSSELEAGVREVEKEASSSKPDQEGGLLLDLNPGRGFGG